MKVDLKHCNNIVEGCITIEDNKLNILYGINGIGKSTIAKSIYYSIHEPEKIALLKPFSTINDVNIKPSTVFDVTPNKVIIYNDDYIKQYLFISSNEILKNSFELFIAPNDLDEQKNYINTQLELINKLLSQNRHLGQLNSLVQQLEPLFTFKKNSETELTPKSKIKQLFDEGNKAHNIPLHLVKFQNYIEDTQAIGWVDWHSKGHSFTDKKENCPFCAKILNDQERKDNNEVDFLFPKATLDVYKKIETSFAHNSELFSKATLQEFTKITKSTSEINIENQNKLIGLYKEAQKLILHMSYSSKYTYDILKEIENIGLELENKKIDISKLAFVDGKDIINAFKEYNKEIDGCIKKAEDLKIKINILNSSIRRTSRENITDINKFLEISGINYKIQLSPNKDKILIVPSVSDVAINVSEHLSYGERNALALALFAFGAKKEENALIILDDPISSYDNNKKYAIIHYLFTGKKHLRNRTILLLTHDLEPIINLYRVETRSIPAYVSAKFIDNNNGKVIEQIINSEDIQSLIDVTLNTIKNTDLSVINRLINLRRYLELIAHDELAYNMLSSLFKGEEKPSFKNSIRFSKEQAEKALKLVQSYITDFEYEAVLKQILDKNLMINLFAKTNSNYEKVEIFRMMWSNFKIDLPDEIMKFINETYHIENTFLFQLNPYTFNSVPAYIVEACKRVVSTL